MTIQYDLGFDAGCEHTKKIYEAEIESLKKALHIKNRYIDSLLEAGNKTLNGWDNAFNKVQEK